MYGVQAALDRRLVEDDVIVVNEMAISFEK